MFRRTIKEVVYISKPVWWLGRVALPNLHFRKFKGGLKSLPNLKKLTLSRDCPPGDAWNVKKSRGNSAETSVKADDITLRLLLEAMNQINAADKSIELELHKSVMVGLLVCNVPSLASALPLLRNIDLYVPYDAYGFPEDHEQTKRMALMLNHAVNLEEFTLRWAYDEWEVMTLAVQVLLRCHWPKLKRISLLRSQGLDWIDFQPHKDHNDNEEIFTWPQLLVQTFFDRHQHVTDVRLRNVLLVRSYEKPVLCDRHKKSPAMELLREILAALPLQFCQVFMDTFKYFDDDSKIIRRLDKQTKRLGKKIGAPKVINETDEDSKVDHTYDFGPWLMERAGV